MQELALCAECHAQPKCQRERNRRVSGYAQRRVSATAHVGVGHGLGRVFARGHLSRVRFVGASWHRAWPGSALALAASPWRPRPGPAAAQ